MRVALACPYGWDAPGGVQVHVRQLAEHLLGRGHEILVLAPSRSSPSEPWVRVVGRPVNVRFNGSVARISPDPRGLIRIRTELRSFRPDVVHVHEPFSPSAGMYATLTASAPVVATFHAYAERSRALSLFSPLLRIVWNRIAVRLAVSHAAASFAGRHFEDGFRIVPNGMDVERFRDAKPAVLPQGERLLFVGRLERRKGFRHAIRAFGLLAAEFPRAVLLVAGEGPERKAVGELPPEVRERVMMLGMVPYMDLPRYHAGADVFLAPNSGGESFGLVLAEAMAAGLPIVASDIAGFREVVRDGREGILVPPGDPAALAAGVRRVLSDPELAQRLSDEGRSRAERFRWETVTAEIEDAYREAVEARRRPR